VDIQEADIAVMGREELEELIDRAVRPDVPLRVLFAALDRYTELLRPVLDDETEPPGPAAAHPGTEYGEYGGTVYSASSDTGSSNTAPSNTAPSNTMSTAGDTGPTTPAAAGASDPGIARHTPSGLDSAIP
jgi:hypothetical protein